jgi:ubiquitin-protein ligase
MDKFQILQNVFINLKKLSLTDIQQWGYGLEIAQLLLQLQDLLKHEEEAKKKAEEAAIEKAKAEREKHLREAAERGETVIGGQTIRLNADGTQEVIIP